MVFKAKLRSTLPTASQILDQHENERIRVKLELSAIGCA